MVSRIGPPKRDQRDQLVVAPDRQAVGGAEPHDAALILVDGDDPIARQAVRHGQDAASRPRPTTKSPSASVATQRLPRAILVDQVHGARSSRHRAWIASGRRCLVIDDVEALVRADPHAALRGPPGGASPSRPIARCCSSKRVAPPVSPGDTRPRPRCRPIGAACRPRPPLAPGRCAVPFRSRDVAEFPVDVAARVRRRSPPKPRPRGAGRWSMRGSPEGLPARPRSRICRRAAAKARRRSCRSKDCPRRPRTAPAGRWPRRFRWRAP